MQSIAETAKLILSGEIEDPSEDTLVEILTVASDEYANEGDSFLDDGEYDLIEKMLKAINPKNLFLAQVGSDVRGGKIPLPYPMGSLDQVYEGDTAKWVKDNGWEDEWFVITDKEDGTSALNIYSKGKLAIAYSRGNGFEGADITRHMSKIKACPQGFDENVAIRLEVIMEDAVFDQQKAQAEAEGGRVYKNARNYVAGRMNASESPALFYDTVRVIGTSVVEPKMSKSDQLELMKRMGFEVPYYQLVQGKDLTDERLIPYLQKRRAESATAIDGIVIDLNDADIRASLRRKSSSINPMYSRKFKVGSEDNVAIAEVVKVHWEPSKTGYLKPRVEIKPVDLVGVTITYATGFNAKFIRENGIGPGAKIQITRSGDVIPFIQKVIESTTPALPAEAEFGKMEWTEGEVDLFLVDASNHPTVQLNRMIDVFASLEVPFLRQGSLEKLFVAGFTDAASVINASEADLKRIIGDSAGGKAFTGIRTKLNPVPLGILAGGSQCMGRGIGRRKMTRLIEAIGEEPILSEVPGPDLAKKIASVEGFEEKTATVIVDNLPAFRQFLNDIEGHYTIAAPPEKVVGGDLEDVVVVFTGIRDKDLEAKIVTRGGTIGNSFNGKTTHLVAKDPTGNSSKLKKARDAGIEPMSIVDARELWG